MYLHQIVLIINHIIYRLWELKINYFVISIECIELYSFK